MPLVRRAQDLEPKPVRLPSRLSEAGGDETIDDCQKKPWIR